MPSPQEIRDKYIKDHSEEDFTYLCEDGYHCLFPDGYVMEWAPIPFGFVLKPPRDLREQAQNAVRYWEKMVNRASNDFYDFKDSLMRAPSNNPDGAELLREKRKHVRKLQRRLAKAEKHAEKTHPQYMPPEARAYYERMAIQQEARAGQLQAEIDKIEI